MCLKYTDTYHPLSILSAAVLFRDGDENGALKKKERETQLSFKRAGNPVIKRVSYIESFSYYSGQGLEHIT